MFVLIHLMRYLRFETSRLPINVHEIRNGLYKKAMLFNSVVIRNGLELGILVLFENRDNMGTIKYF